MTIQKVSERMKEEWKINGPYVVISGLFMYALAGAIAAAIVLGILGKLPSLPS
jgi:hypothetical protein